MADQFFKDTVYIVSKSARKYDVLRTQNGVVFKKRKTPSVLPDYVKPRPKPTTVEIPQDKVVSIINRPNNIVNVKPEKEVVKASSAPAPISNSMSFSDLQKKVEELRKKEAEKNTTASKVVEGEENEVPVVTIEDADELASGLVSKEQELINKEYLKSLNFSTLKKVYSECTGEKPDKNASKFEIRREILKVYEESNAKRKKEIYESSRI